MIELDPSLSLQSAMVARIKADSKLAELGLGGRVFDSIPQNTPFPYIKIGEDLVTPLDHYCGSSSELISTVRVYSRKPGRVECKRFAERLRFLLTKAGGLTVDGFRVVLGYCEGYSIEQHSDGLTHQAIIEFSYRIEPKEKLAAGRGIIPAPIVSAAAKVRIAAQAALGIVPRVSGASRVRLMASAAIVLPALMASASATIFSPDRLFAASETGAVYDPSDLTSLYQLRTGGANVTAPGQTAGIMLDKSRMDGKSAAQFIADQPELLTNGGFDTDTAWTKGTGWTISGGVASINAPGAPSNLFQTIAAQIGDWVLVTATVSRSAGQLVIFAGSAGTGGANTFLSSATQTRLIRVTGAVVALYLQANASFVGTVESVSCKVIPGFHAIAPSDAARPLYGREPVTGRRNLLTWTEDLSNAAWTKFGVSVAASPHATPLGGVGWQVTGLDAANDRVEQFSSNTATPGATWRLRVRLRGSGVIRIGLQDNSGAGGTDERDAALTSEWVTHERAVTFNGSAAGSIRAILITRTGSNPEVHVGDWQLERDTLGTYQKVTTALDVTEAGVASRHFLQPDGVDDWMQVLPVCNLGETWAHVGGWRSDALSRRPFATSSFVGGAPIDGATKWDWLNSAAAQAAIADGNCRTPHVLTIEQASTNNLSGRYNGTGGSTITPSDDRAGTQGLALFTQQNNLALNPLSGRFYGGTWINRALTTSERAALERWQSIRTLAA